mmetsp:Transcript_38780/g.123189  ORF Transcript_38780/g.123189 Transcript_38780/m.123189 type:complete len:331 (-) Transcript_38780:339-1331(-)
MERPGFAPSPSAGGDRESPDSSDAGNADLEHPSGNTLEVFPWRIAFAASAPSFAAACWFLSARAFAALAFERFLLQRMKNLLTRLISFFACFTSCFLMIFFIALFILMASDTGPAPPAPSRLPPLRGLPLSPCACRPSAAASSQQATAGGLYTPSPLGRASMSATQTVSISSQIVIVITDSALSTGGAGWICTAIPAWLPPARPPASPESSHDDPDPLESRWRRGEEASPQSSETRDTRTDRKGGGSNPLPRNASTTQAEAAVATRGRPAAGEGDASQPPPRADSTAGPPADSTAGPPAEPPPPRDPRGKLSIWNVGANSSSTFSSSPSK